MTVEVGEPDTAERVAGAGERAGDLGAAPAGEQPKTDKPMSEEEAAAAAAAAAAEAAPEPKVADPFDYRVTKQGGVIVSRGGRVVMTVGGGDAARLVVALQRADDSQAQHLLARASGNYRRGNERA